MAAWDGSSAAASLSLPLAPSSRSRGGGLPLCSILALKRRLVCDLVALPPSIAKPSESCTDVTARCVATILPADGRAVQLCGS